MNKENTAIRLKQILEERNLKQVDVINMSKPLCTQYGIRLEKNDLSQYLSGKTEPGQNKLFILAKTLNVNEAWLMGFDVPKDRTDNEKTTPSETTHTEPLKNNIKKLRISNGVTQSSLANYLNVERDTLANWEQGKFDVDNTSLQKIADYFQCSVDYVLDRGETSEPAPSKTESHNTSEELMRKAQTLEENGGGRRILAYGGTVEDDSLASKIKALERQHSHSRDEDSYLLFQTKRQESGAVLFGYDPNGKWVSKTLTAKEAEFVFNVIKSLENLT